MKAYFACGCFWGAQKYFDQLEGVSSTEVGYMGGDEEFKANYRDVCTGLTNHAEVVSVDYDFRIISYRELLKYFFRIHDASTLNRQHNDKGSQYRSAIFTNNDEEVDEIKNIITKLDKHQVYYNKVVTSIESSQRFYKAEDEHQKYLLNHPTGYMCHILKGELPFS